MIYEIYNSCDTSLCEEIIGKKELLAKLKEYIEENITVGRMKKYKDGNWDFEKKFKIEVKVKLKKEIKDE